jgi:hypothetical protein
MSEFVPRSAETRLSYGPNWREHLYFLIAAVVCCAAFIWMITYGSGRIVAEDSFGNFYDWQAKAWLHGRWDVPEPALSGEAFIVDGKVYGYFGPTPALLRLPFVIAGVEFGRLTRAFMLLEYVASLVAAYLILYAAGRRISSVAPSAWLVVVFTLSVGLGSTLFFLGSRAYVYHEAILCGAAFALWSTWCTLRYFAAPCSRWWIGAVLFGTLAVHARPPIGLFALTFAACVALNHLIKRRQIEPLGVAVAAGAAVLSFNAISYMKFGTFEGCPLRYNVQYTPDRLAALGGRNFHLSNLRFNADSYLWQPSASVRPNFPYIYLEYIDRKKYPESKIAYRDPTLAVPYSMPALVFLALSGCGCAALTTRRLLRPIALLWLAATPLTIAMLTAVAVTQRYTADFCAFLIPAAAFGGVAIWSWLGWRKRLGAILTSVLTAASIAIQAAITLHHQRAVVWGVPVEVHHEYEGWRQRIDAGFHSRPDH